MPNIGFFVNDWFFHPRRRVHRARPAVRTLMVPRRHLAEVVESIDYIRAVRPRLAVSAHDGLLNDIGLGLVDNLMGRIAEQAGSGLPPAAPFR